jgi:hypothetical protein
MMMFIGQPKPQIKLSQNTVAVMKKLLGKEESQTENKLTEETVEENLRNLTSVLKPIPECGSTYNHMFYMSTVWNMFGARGGAVVEELCYKPEGRGFDSRWCHRNSSLT